MMKIVHPVVGVIARLTIATFWLSTTLTELLGSRVITPSVIHTNRKTQRAVIKCVRRGNAVRATITRKEQGHVFSTYSRHCPNYSLVVQI